jgi:hypothetical protein
MKSNRKQFVLALSLLVLGVAAACFAAALAAAGVQPFNLLVFVGGFSAQAIWAYGVAILAAGLLLGTGAALTLRVRRSVTS